MKVISRKDAKAKGMKRYFTGNACIRGHVAERFTCNKTCVACDAMRKESRKAKIQTKIEVVSVPKKIVRIVRFQVIGRDRRFAGNKKFDHNIIEDTMVSVG